jgi:hypothetical protein
MRYKEVMTQIRRLIVRVIGDVPTQLSVLALAEVTGGMSHFLLRQKNEAGAA